MKDLEVMLIGDLRGYLDTLRSRMESYNRAEGQAWSDERPQREATEGEIRRVSNKIKELS